MFLVWVRRDLETAGTRLAFPYSDCAWSDGLILFLTGLFI